MLASPRARLAIQDAPIILGSANLLSGRHRVWRRARRSTIAAIARARSDEHLRAPARNRNGGERRDRDTGGRFTARVYARDRWAVHLAQHPQWDLRAERNAAAWDQIPDFIADRGEGRGRTRSENQFARERRDAALSRERGGGPGRIRSGKRSR